MEGNLDKRKLQLDLCKAEALKELRPHINTSAGGGTLPAPAGSGRQRAVMRYLGRVLYGHLELLFDSYPLPTNLDAEDFTDRALADAKAHASSALVSQIADDQRVYLCDSCRVAYLQELASKTGYRGVPRAGSTGRADDDQPPSGYETFLAKLQTGIIETASGQRLGHAKLARQKASQPSRKMAQASSQRRKGSGGNERLSREREALLTAYKQATGVTSDWSIYNCAGKGTHSCHKPQFLQWKRGVLPPTSQSCQSLERFLHDRREPPGLRTRKQKNLPVLPTSTN